MFVCAAHVTRDRDNLVEVSDGYTIFRPPYSCTTKIHYHGDLSSVNLCKNISKNIWSLEKHTDLKLGEVFSFSSARWSGYFLWYSGRGRSLTDLYCRLERFVDIYLCEYENFQSLIFYISRNMKTSVGRKSLLQMVLQALSAWPHMPQSDL